MRPEDIRDKKVLLSPLNWGMGHVSRCIGLIHQLLQQGNEIHVACEIDHAITFGYYFEEHRNLRFYEHDGYPFNFKGNGKFALDLLRNWSDLKRRLVKEQKEVRDFTKGGYYDVVISDHRYGFYSENVTSVFMTHQYHLPVKGWQFIANRWHKKRMQPFHHVWILDYPDSRLSGKMSAQANDDRVEFIGPYSRFSFYSDTNEKSEPNVVVVSGPLVYAQQFADEMVEQFPDALFICSPKIHLDSKIRRISGNWKEQDQAILDAQRLVSRSGYSTIMDLEILKIPALLHPTPGQAEQLYLHDRLTDCSEYTP